MASTEQQQASLPTFSVGQIVQVEARTWPGINKPGGVGRITQLHCSSSNNDGNTKLIASVDVRYTVVGGRERHVPIEHVRAAPEFDVAVKMTTENGQGSCTASATAAVGQQQHQLRDRSGLLGRCKRCGSLRADCGSCDWMEQERLAEQERNQSSQQAAVATKIETSRRRMKAKSRKRTQRATGISPRDESSTSSSSSSDGEHNEAEYIRRRQYRKLKPYWERLFNDVSDASEESTSGSGNESDLNDPLLRRLDALTQRSRERKSRLAKKYATTRKGRSQRRRPKATTGLSTLEALPEPSVSRTRDVTTTKVSSVARGHASPSSDTLGDGRSPFSPRLPSAPKQPEMHVHDVGEVEVSSEDDGLPPLSPTWTSPPTRHEQIKAPATKEEDNDILMGSPEMATTAPPPDDDVNLDLEGVGFIQPEGEAAADHLPSDIVDRTQSIPYKQLPSFFDDLLQELANEVIPDSKLALADFQRQTREARNQSDIEELNRLKATGLELYTEIQRNVIRNGIDQCREAMRRMISRRQRRNYKQKMTREEWKLFRDTALEARDAQLDVLLPDAEMVLRDARAALLDEFSIAIEMEIGDDEASESSDGSISSPSTRHVDESTLESDMSIDEGEAASLPPFDPHMHASVVRRKKSRTSSRQASTSGCSRSRRRKQRNSGKATWTGDWNEPELASHTQYRAHSHRRSRKRPGSISDESEGPIYDCYHGPPEGDAIAFGSIGDDETIAARKLRRGEGRKARVDHFVRNDVPAPRGSHRVTNRIPMADRMQAFLDANAANADGTLDEFTSHFSDGVQKDAVSPLRQQRREQPNKRRRSVAVSRHIRNPRDNDFSVVVGEHLTSELDEGTEDSHIMFSTDAIYQRLERRVASKTPRTREESLTAPTVCLSDACKDLLATYRSSPCDCAATFKSIVHHFKVQPQLLREEAVEAFQALVQILRECGSMLLQFVALFDSGNFAHHIRLLVFTLELLKCDVHSVLTHDDGIVFDLFGGENYKIFVEQVVMQMMDVVYAGLQPSWWGLDNALFPRAIEKLVPLRDALAALVPLVETMSRCTMETFQRQTWRQIDGRSGAFVSALDPAEYKSLLLTGRATQPNPQQSGLVRFQLYKKAVPRREIDTIWFLFAFCAGAPGPESGGPKHRWRLLASLFGNTAGVLSTQYFESTSKDETKLPPGKDHLTRCEAEIDRFRVLLSSKAINPLPDSDSFLTKLVQKCLLLITEDLQYSLEDGSEKGLFAFDVTDCARVSRMWKVTRLPDFDASLALLGQPSNPGEQMIDSSGRRAGHATGYLPMITLFGSCEKLSGAWIEQLPAKKARRSRFAQSLRKLVLDFVEHAAKLEASKTRNTVTVLASTFEEAFAVKASNVGSRYAGSVLREAAARLSIVGTIGGVSGPILVLSKELRERVWHTLADSVMKLKQQSILMCEATNPSTFGGDLSSIVSIAKTMAWLTELHWLSHDDIGVGLSLETLPKTLSSEPDDDEGTLTFLASCLSTCLDCACDTMDAVDAGKNHELHISEDFTSQFESLSKTFSCICLWLSQLLVRARAVLQISSTSDSTPISILHQAAKMLRQRSIDMFVPTLKRSLASMTNSPFHGEHGDLALLSVLGLVRAVVGLVSTCPSEEAEQSYAMEFGGTYSPQRMLQPPESDLFGSMDDSLFLNIDLGGNTSVPSAVDQGDIEGSGRGCSSSHMLKEIWSVLIDMMKFSKPSERFAILPQRLSSGALMSTPGRTRATNNIGEVCSCLAALTTLGQLNLDEVDMSLDMFTKTGGTVVGWGARDGPDESFFRSVAQCFYSEMCSLSTEYDQCDRLLKKRWENIFQQFVDAMLDSNTLERFPSMNLKRIKASCGIRGERRQRLRISLANSTQDSDQATASSVNEAGARLGRGEKSSFPGPAYNSSHLWSFSENLGKALTRIGVDDRLATLFASNLPGDRGDSIALVSLEKECLRRFRLFRGILSYTSKHGTIRGPISFEGLSNQIISSCCCQLAAISRGVDYQSRHGRDEAQRNTRSYKHARLLELQACYSELTVSLLSWILRECPTTKSTMFDSTLQCVRDLLFSRALLGKKCDIHTSLEQLYRVATQMGVSNTTSARASNTLEADESGVWNDICVAIVRRSYEIMLHLATSYRQDGMRNVYSLFNSLITVATSCTEESSHETGCHEEWASVLIARSMDVTNRAVTSMTSSHLHMDITQFQRDLDESMRHVALERVDDIEEAKALQHLRQVAIRQFLAPKLAREDVTLSQKKGIICFSSALVEIEARCSPAVEQDRLELSVIACMIKGIASCMRETLELPVVDDNILSKSFECCRHLFNLPPPAQNDTDQDDADDATLLSWCLRYKDDCDNAKQQSYALYMWTFATWMSHHVGKMLVGGSNQDKEALRTFRAKAISLKSSHQEGRSIWTEDQHKDSSDARRGDSGSSSSICDNVVMVSSRLVSLEDGVFDKENARPVVTNVYTKSKLLNSKQPPESLRISSGADDMSLDQLQWTPSSSVRRAVKELQAKVIALL